MLTIIKAGGGGGIETASSSDSSITPTVSGSNLEMKVARAMNPKKREERLDSFNNIGHLQGPMMWIVSANSGGISVVGTHVDGNHLGILEFTTSTSASSAPHIVTGLNHMTSGGGELTAEWLVRFPNLSDATDSFVARAGFTNAYSSSLTDGIYFEYTHSVNAGNWTCKTGSNASFTTANSGTPVAINTWYRLTAVVNAAGTLATFYINGTQVGTISTNIPTGARLFGVGAGMYKTAGTTARKMFADYGYYLADLTTER